jgi:hypothetical protein
MTKQEALSRAKAARHAANLAQARVALYAATFGGANQLVQHAMLESDVATEVAQKWERIATLHPRTRARLIREQLLPVYMFGYGVQA